MTLFLTLLLVLLGHSASRFISTKIFKNILSEVLLFFWWPKYVSKPVDKEDWQIDWLSKVFWKQVEGSDNALQYFHR